MTKAGVMKTVQAACLASLGAYAEPKAGSGWMTGARMGAWVPIQGFEGWELSCVADKAHVCSKYDSHFIFVRNSVTKRVLWDRISMADLKGPVGYIAQVVRHGGFSQVETDVLDRNAAIKAKLAI